MGTLTEVKRLGPVRAPAQARSGIAGTVLRRLATRVYNRFGLGRVILKRTMFVRTMVVTVAMFSLLGSMRADDLEDSYTKLKDAVAKKDVAAVKSSGAATFKLAEALVNAPQPSAADEVANWKQRVEYGKEVVAYTEYALAATASQVQNAAETIDLVNTLLAQNPKSQYLDQCTQAYLAALGKSGTAKQLEGMSRIVRGRPDDVDALAALAQGLMSRSPGQALVYANRLVGVLKTKAKPEGVSEAEWDRAKGEGLAAGYYVAGVISGAQSAWLDCNRDLHAAQPLIHDNARLGVVYFYLGLANYQLGKMTLDRPQMQVGLKYSQQAAAIPGPMRDQAYHNVLAIQNELGRR